MQNQFKQIVGLDLIRFAAALLVSLFHLGYWSWKSESSSAKKIIGSSLSFHGIEWFTAWGWVGVETFFVLSGFVILYSAQGRSASQFLRSRAVRLVPAAWICATITASFLLVGTITPYRSIVHQYLSSVFFSPIPPWVDGSYWTLGVEVAFYGIVWLTLLLQQEKRMLSVVMTIGLISSGYWFVKATAYYFTGSAFFPFIDEFPNRMSELLLMRHGCFFAIGGLLWYVLCNRGAPVLWLAILLFVVAGSAEITDLAINYYAKISNEVYWITPTVVWLMSLVAIVLSVVANSSLNQRLNARFCRGLGLATYPLYLLHQVVGAIIMVYLFGLGVTEMKALILTIVIATAMSVIVAMYLEKPAQAWLKRILERCTIN